MSFPVVASNLAIALSVADAGHTTSPVPDAVDAIVISTWSFPLSSAIVSVTLLPSIKFNCFLVPTTAPLFFTTSTFCVLELLATSAFSQDPSADKVTVVVFCVLRSAVIVGLASSYVKLIVLVSVRIFPAASCANSSVYCVTSPT